MQQDPNMPGQQAPGQGGGFEPADGIPTPSGIGQDPMVPGADMPEPQVPPVPTGPVGGPEAPGPTVPGGTNEPGNMPGGGMPGGTLPPAPATGGM